MIFHEEISRIALLDKTIVQFGFLSWVNINSRDAWKLFVQTRDMGTVNARYRSDKISHRVNVALKFVCPTIILSAGN